jgi:hypothetical protein
VAARATSSPCSRAAMFVFLYERAALSYEKALIDYRERVAKNIQPSTPILDVFNVDTQETLLTAVCVTYLVIAASLFVHMKVQLEY